jgi:hypothetical protein
LNLFELLEEQARRHGLRLSVDESGSVVFRAAPTLIQAAETAVFVTAALALGAVVLGAGYVLLGIEAVEERLHR